MLFQVALSKFYLESQGKHLNGTLFKESSTGSQNIISKTLEKNFEAKKSSDYVMSHHNFSKIFSTDIH